MVFVTANPRKIPEDFTDACGVIPKPFSRGGLMAALRYLEAGIYNPPLASSYPNSFLPASRLFPASG